MAFNPFQPGFYASDELRQLGFGAVGRNVKISKDCVIVGRSQIFLGDDIRIDSRVTITATSGNLTMAGQNHVGGGCRLGVAADLTIGMHSGFSQDVQVHTSVDEYAGNWPESGLGLNEDRDYSTQAITIGNYCVFGAGTIILPGCSAANGAAVGSLSVVTEPLDEWTLYHGNPARRVRNRGRRAEALGEQLAAIVAREHAAL